MTRNAPQTARPLGDANLTLVAKKIGQSPYMTAGLISKTSTIIRY